MATDPTATWNETKGCFTFGPDDPGVPRDGARKILSPELARCPALRGEPFDAAKHIRVSVDELARKARLRREAQQTKALAVKPTGGSKKPPKQAHPQDRLEASGF